MKFYFQKMTSSLFVILILIANSDASHAAEKKKTTSAKPSSSGQIIWNNWYTVTIGGKTPYAYYNEKLSVKEGKLHYQNELWKKEEDFINRESFGGFSENNPSYTPLFFNFYSTYRTSETKIDGTIENGENLVVKVNREGKDLPVVRKHLPKGVFLSTYFPLWLKDSLTSMKPNGSPKTFSTLLEDSVDTGFKVESGYARLENPDEFAKKTNTRKVSVQYRDRPSVWYVDSTGVYVHMVMGNNESTADLVTEAKAKKFLDGK